MTDRITLINAARLNGDSDGTYRSVASQHFPKMGKKVGRERMVDQAEALLLRITTETASGNLSLKEAAGRALGLFPFIQDIAAGRLGTGKDSVFAVDCWGLIGLKQRRLGYICESREQLSLCINAVTLAGWPNLRVMNLTNLMVETLKGWNIALLGPDLAEAMLKEEIAQHPHDAEFELQLFEHLKQRFGDRRGEAPKSGAWQRWKDEQPQAAA